MKTTLVLNSAYEPLGTVSWKRAFVLCFLGKAEALNHFQDFEIKTNTSSFKCPAVLRIFEYVNIKRAVKFNKQNVFIRDGFRCQYCGKIFSKEKLTLDHVIPRSRGGVASWRNSVSCCKSCNQYKADMTPKEAGMCLLREPCSPKIENFYEKSEKEWEEWL